MNNKKISRAAHNLLIECARLRQSDTLLIVREKESLGWYKNDISDFILGSAVDMGIDAFLHEVGSPEITQDQSFYEKMNQYSCVIFFARLGDQDRFENKGFSTKRVMSYVRDCESLASVFGTLDYNLNILIKDAIDRLIENSNIIKINCPLGTNLVGEISNDISKAKEVSVLRFPILVPKPIEAKPFSGTVVLNNYLTSTGSRFYKPNFIKIKGQVTIHIENGSIADIQGTSDDVNNIHNHYTYVSKKFDIDTYAVHSWHPGIHPGAEDNKFYEYDPDKWSNTVFGQPKYLHFHTCGNYAPGEICWMISNHTVLIDDKPLWKNGELMLNDFEPTKVLLEKYEPLKKVFSGI
ncbi:hypothetical protein OA871_01835 [Paracoccaceae bacterium]|nr:hypothetical protein [Paracoccaceae bacterium]